MPRISAASRQRPGLPGGAGGDAGRLAAALESTAALLILVERDWRVAYANRRAEACFGDRRRRLAGRNLWEFWPRRDSLPSRQMLVRAMEQQSPRQFEDFFPGLDAWFDIEAQPWQGGLALWLRDVTERRHLARDLAAREARYRAIFACAGDAIVVCDGLGIVQEVNPAAEAMFGYAAHELEGRHVGLLGGAAGDWLGAAGRREATARRRDGTAVPLELSRAEWRHDGRAFFAVIGRERRPPETEKMAALGALAGGIAHDFGNFLLVIGSQLDLAAEAAAAPAPLAVARTAVARAGDLVRQLLAFARAGEGRRERVALAPAIGAALDLVAAGLPKRIALRRDIDPCGDILGDGAELHRLILNLAANAVDAIGRRRGTIRVALGGEPGSGEARLVVADDGAGMTPEVAARAFEPFFSAKGGRGTGLGLAVVHAIVAGQGGTIAVDSAPDAGTRFTIRLPLLPPPG